MWSTYETTAALAEARSSKKSLSAVKQGTEQTEAPPTGSDKSVANVLETLSAVVPTGIAGLYTLLTLAQQASAVSDQKARSAALAAAMAKAGKSKAEIQAALAKLVPESGHFLILRWSTLALFTVAVVVQAVLASRGGVQTARDKSTEHSKKVQIAPTATALLAFLAWAFASPGTPLGHYFVTGDLAVVTTTIAVIGALFLLVLGRTVTSQPVEP